MNILPFISPDNQYGRPILIANREQLVQLVKDYDTGLVDKQRRHSKEFLAYISNSFPIIVTFYHQSSNYITYGWTTSINYLNFIGTPVPYNKVIYKRQ